MKNFYVLLLAVLLTCQLNAQLVVDNSLSPEQVIEDAFLANGIFVANIVFTGTDSQIGTFEGSQSNVGLSNGIVMGSGDAVMAVGPNNSGSSTSGGGEIFGNLDPDLAIILDGYTANDVAIVEFDFIATGDSLDFQFVFGSEEYSEFVESSFNDAFGFFISGPGINGTFSNSAVNIALIPGTNIPVAINNLNNGYNNQGPCDNCEYFIYNGDGMEEPYSTDNTVIQCDGFTTVLHASIGDLVVGEAYHIKLAIADASDAAFDSYVFLGGESFVQFCNEEVGIVDDVCMLSTLEAHVEFTDDCGTINLQNYSDINIEYTNCFFEMGDGNIVNACVGDLSHTYAEAGTYQLKLVYEVGDFQAKFKVGEVIIAATAPELPSVSNVNNVLTATNWNGTDMIQWYVNEYYLDGANSVEYDAGTTGEGFYTVTYTNSCGTTQSEQILVVSTEEIELAEVVIYPNPSEGTFFVNSQGRNVVVKLYNHLGQILFTKSLNGIMEINSDVSAGAYVLEISDSTNSLEVRRETLIIR